jgi:predicted RNA binding protein YcfA (HicA-like mRNA interferase family)
VKPVPGERMCRILEKNGWGLVRTRDSHRSHQHPNQPGTIIIPAHRNDDLKRGTQHDIMRQAGLTEDDL